MNRWRKRWPKRSRRRRMSPSEERVIDAALKRQQQTARAMLEFVMGLSLHGGK